jgi:hypothetical protein
MKFQYVKALLIFALLAVASVALSQPTLTPFPEARKDYTYHIELPEGTTGIAIFWYYGMEANTHMIYRSGYKAVKCCVVETEMYFPRPGVYILTVWYDRYGKVEVMRRKYVVRHSWRI